MLEATSSSSGGVGGGGLVLLVLGGVLLKRRDALVVSRFAGRLCGSSLHLLRVLRDSVTQQLEEHAKSNVGMQNVREKVYDSMRQFEDISRVVRREFQQSSPVAGIRHAAKFASRPRPGSRVGVNSAGTMGKENASVNVDMDVAQRDSRHGSVSAAGPTAATSGVDVVCRVIEEAAFAEQHARITGTYKHNDEENRDT